LSANGYLYNQTHHNQNHYEKSKVPFSSKRLVFKTFEVDYLETFSYAQKYNYEKIYMYFIVKNDMDTIQFEVHTIFQYGEFFKKPYL
jgi:uncharacterized UPF0160 family protein